MKISKRDTCDRYYIFSLLGFALFIHKLHHDEEIGVYHNHPWSGISIILGSYWEQRFGDILRQRRWFHFLPAKTHHRLELKGKTVWTIFFHFRRCNKWTVIDKNGNILVTEPWRAIGGITSYRPKD